ncbi:MobF family relaxase [Geodermatophilus obscurus]|uniref:TrwC relaxase n=1 Tax=Geodermatophilus obscurus (strain ATCC 25078 / DSM 43160 / JCM 3152 / CCUG 61914 / KCC A-0152 / KCTC 9177 / NBRC 13315 / NRRL B-3577 / G-20) TaxID=526225 RepID=D2S894_GEOOG|nr:MobF family relaxase [Geodermatophilus obscurus]ADB73516.1 TrwC relaxase [Geodermatophilus obscurus DSM 43160]
MSLHKLTAGDGYTYLTRQVAAMDATERGLAGLGDYYSQRGESPGVWAGGGLAGLSGVSTGQPVAEAQMQALFGRGRHPDAGRLEAQARAAGRTAEQARAAGALGLPFLVYPAPADGLRARCAQEFAAINAARGRPRDASLPEPERARIRGEVARGMFTEAYGRPPADARELSGFLARASRLATRAVAGYDLTFSPVKSVSALWALAPREVAERVETAHAAAVADTLAWLEKHACFTRLGAGGARQVETTGLIAAVFTHRDSRAGDPDLHTHVAVSNKVQTDDGRWRAVDGRVLYKANVAASEHYNTRLEAHLVAGLGVHFAERPGREPGKRTVREVVGVDSGLLTTWSSRRQAIDVRRGQLAAGFQAEHGRPPTTSEAIALAQQATLETREAKHEPRSLAEQRAAWRKQALGVLGSPSDLAAMLDRVLGRAPAPRPSGVPEVWVRSAAATVLATVSGQRASWQFWHVCAEAERLVRAAGLAPGDVDRAVSRVTETALSPALSVPLGAPDAVVEPPELRRSDGASVYTVAGAQRYTSRAVLDAEALLVTAAGRTDGRRADPAVVELALLEATANGTELNPGQAQLVRDLAGSGARVQLAVAPAGAGKTTALATLARAWTAGGGTVLGLAPSAVAAAVLRSALAGRCDTLAKLSWSLDAGTPPDWVAGIGPGTLVVVDEAGMAGTVELARAVEHILRRGGSVRLVGDPQQLTAVAAGGVLGEIAATHGAVTLTQLVRFAEPAEAAATVALRDGDTTGLGFYLDVGRVHVGDLVTCAEQAYAAWAADRAAGKDALLLAATREVVARLNERARADRLVHSPGPPGPEVVLADGTRAGAGDAVITRRNDRTLPLGASDWVKNGDRFTVHAVGGDGALAVVHTGTKRRLTLPAAYVGEHVRLGYAATVHGAQGVTADTCHTVLTGAESRQLLYVALSRGRSANHLYLSTVGDGDPHSIITPAAVHPPTATDLLVAMLARDDAQASATGARRALADPAGQLRTAAVRYADALRFAAEHRLGPEVAEELEGAAEYLRPGLTAAPAWPTLRGHLALLALSDTDPVAALTTAAGMRELDSAADPTAVLDWRLPATGPPGPLPWLPAVPAALAEDPHWGPYLAARAALLTDCAARVAATAATMTPATAPGWARSLLADDRASLRADLAVWRAATDIPADDRRPTGPPRFPTAERSHQAQLDQALAVTPTAGRSVWAALADSLDPRIRRDTHWPALAEQLTAADRAGLDAAGLFAAVAAQRPLPDDLPAAALWWRLAPHLAPVTVPPIGPAAGALRPEWCAVLFGLLPAERTQPMLGAPAWPALVAAVTTGIRAGWAPADLLGAAIAGLPATVTADPAGDEVAEALVFRVAALTDPAPIDVLEPLPADLQPPDDAHLLPPVDASTTATVHPAGVLSGDEDVPFDPDYDTLPLAAAPRFSTPNPITSTGAVDAGDDADYLLEQHFWATAAVPRDRLIALNTQAAAFFTDRYVTSWAPGYLRERLGTDLTADPRFSPGYAPAGWTALVDHLRGLGATEDELLAAGLAQCARTGALIDRFRDRLTFPIHDLQGTVVGFIARRNPTAPHDGPAGPKYLNTPGTDLYRKGEHLFGLHEARAALTADATPALVEGPLDALALALAGAGQTVGVATLGTALTDRQADLLRPYIRGGDGPGILVATDNDPPGRQAAERIYWQLTTRGDDPRRLALPDGLDPADLLHRDGPTALRTAVDTSSSLADSLLDARLTPAAHDRSPSDIHTALRDAAAVIVALPPGRWLAHIDRVTEVLGVPPGTVHRAVLDTEPITAAPRGATTGPQRTSRLTPPSEDRHRTGLTGRPSHGTRPDLHHSR